MHEVFLIADLHIGHTNIIRFEAAKRPFSTIEEHDETLIDNWNKLVGKRDTVWVLGDVAMGKRSLEQVGRLRGLKKLVMGNHDTYRASDYERYFTKVYGVAKYDGLILSHVPVHPGQSYRFRGNVHGHTHSKRLDSIWYHCVSVEQLPIFGQPIPITTIVPF